MHSEGGLHDRRYNIKRLTFTASSSLPLSTFLSYRHIMLYLSYESELYTELGNNHLSVARFVRNEDSIYLVHQIDGAKEQVERFFAGILVRIVLQ